jgi:hypothetical protein
MRIVEMVARAGLACKRLYQKIIILQQPRFALKVVLSVLLAYVVRGLASVVHRMNIAVQVVFKAIVNLALLVHSLLVIVLLEKLLAMMLQKLKAGLLLL